VATKKVVYLSFGFKAKIMNHEFYVKKNDHMIDCCCFRFHEEER
jgi:hypothetical protein